MIICEAMVKNTVTSPKADSFIWEQPQPRIVQYDKRRYALRLEGAFWQQLEAIADRRGLRVGALVAELAAACDGPNLSSYIRGFCMVEATRDIARYRLSAGAFDLVTIMRGAPTPALLLDESRLILETNRAFTDWLGADAGPVLRMAKFDAFFTPRVTRPLDETFALMRKKMLQRAQMQVTYAPPDGLADLKAPRVANATLTGLPVGSFFYCLVWLDV